MKRFLFRIVFLFLICPFLSSLIVGQASAHPSSYVSYSCGDYSNNHCYGYIQENASGQSSSGKFWGVTTSVDARILTISSGVYGSVDNEMWFNDDADSNCNYAGGACWIEVGYTYDNGGTIEGIYVPSLGTHMFWSDVRANNFFCLPSCGYHEHIKGLFSLSSSDVGKKITLTITNSGGLRNNWKVSASMSGKSFVALSTNNFIPGSNDIQIGQELAGSGFSGINAVAPRAEYASNRYQSSVGGSWTSYTSSGITSASNGWSNNPPWSGWTYNPGSAHPGGQWHTCTLISTGAAPC